MRPFSVIVPSCASEEREVIVYLALVCGWAPCRSLIGNGLSFAVAQQCLRPLSSTSLSTRSYGKVRPHLGPRAVVNLPAASFECCFINSVARRRSVNSRETCQRQQRTPCRRRHRRRLRRRVWPRASTVLKI